jgi:galactokinase/mevalonate kinase-like predicted kinase
VTEADRPTAARVAEGTAACRVDLAGGAPGAVSVTVAIDRRPWCRVETGVAGVRIESKDTLRKVGGEDVFEALRKGAPATVARVLQAMGVKTGVWVVTQCRVPEGSGLGESSALAAAVAGALARVQGSGLDKDGIARIATEADTPRGEAGGGLRESHTAVRGGVLALHPEAAGLRVESLAIDPARVEESLLLVDAGAPRSPADGQDALSAIPSIASRVRDALLAGRFEEVIGLWAEEWELRRSAVRGWPAPEAERIAGVVRAAGGAARVCGAGQGGILALWAPPGARGPGRREAVAAAAKAAGLRLFPARVDLRGLDVA